MKSPQEKLVVNENKLQQILDKVSITEPQGSSITNSVTQSITAQSELIA